ncbi:MAG: Xaa-Pro peptidase family protein [Ancalomicrobiaceae bacterium]|nr:Xaa-Pro peptidase family protein [Ancalomicrobiaceae bacterium]
MIVDANIKRARLGRLLSAMDAERLDAVALVPGANFYFLTGAHFHLMERPTVHVVTRSGAQYAVIPALEKARWAALSPDVETIYWQDADGYAAAFAKLAQCLPPGRLGVEGQRMRTFEYLALVQALAGTALVDAHAAISAMRLCKDVVELDAMSRAIAISETALARTLARTRAGMSEAAIRQMLVADMLEEGADGVAFEPIVLAGGASADPHGSPSPDRLLQRGEPLLIDYGAAWGGYNADITRTVFCETVSAEHRALYEAVLAGNAVGRVIAAPGVTLDAVDIAVGNAMRAAGFADLILHKTGHGLGLDVHEAPQVMIGNMQRLAPGMVITIEPGLYRDGEIGVRIEDDVVVTDTGARSLTSYPRELTLIG